MPVFAAHHRSTSVRLLNPLDPRHYGLLLLWVYFQPSQLKHYLYAADPELYRETSRNVLAKAWRVPAYRNLYEMALVLAASLAIGCSALGGLLQGTAVDGLRLFIGTSIGVALGLAWSLVYGAAWGVTLSVGWGAAFGVAGGIPLGPMWGLLGGLMLGLAWNTSMAMGGGIALGALLGISVGFLVGVAVKAVMATGWDVAILWGVGGIVGGLRLVMLVIDWLGALWAWLWRRDPLTALERHPVVWDELAVWPMPGLVTATRAGLEANFPRGLSLVARTAANPFQRWAVQRALSDFLNQQVDPLAVLYDLLHEPVLDAYLLLPIIRFQFQEFPSARQALLGEVGQLRVDGTGGYSETSERAVWRATRPGRRTRFTPLAGFSRLFYELFNRGEALADLPPLEIAQTLRTFQRELEGLPPIPHGDEIIQALARTAASLEAQNLNAVAEMVIAAEPLPTQTAEPLLPRMENVFAALGDVSAEARVCVHATNPGHKAAALNRAAGLLNELAGYVSEHVLPPERVLLQRVVAHWQSLIAAEQGQLGEAALRDMTPAARRAAGVADRQSGVWQKPAKPFDNPYVVGNPVYPPLFVGRADIFNRIGEIWSAKAVPDSIILYGHRRMGKSSILRNLGEVAPPGSVIAYADLAGETAFVESVADLLLNLADKIYAAVHLAHPQAALARPDPAAYDTPAHAQTQFNRFTDSAREVLGGHTLILALDEFEAIEKAVAAGRLGKELYEFLRAKTQEPWLTLVFGGLHTLDEMSRDYQQPFYGSYANIVVSYLKHDDAWRLITGPRPDFALNYEPEAVERIIAETGSQPYLVQQVCRDALDHLNAELFDAGKERAVLITLADVDAVLGPDFFQHGSVYFDGVWTQAEESNQRTVLTAMAAREGAWPLVELEAAVSLPAEVVRAALHWAERHDILRKLEPGWEYCVPLMRRWVWERKR